MIKKRSLTQIRSHVGMSVYRHCEIAKLRDALQHVGDHKFVGRLCSIRYHSIIYRAADSYEFVKIRLLYHTQLKMFLFYTE